MKRPRILNDSPDAPIGPTSSFGDWQFIARHSNSHWGHRYGGIAIFSRRWTDRPAEEEVWLRKKVKALRNKQGQAKWKK